MPSDAQAGGFRETTRTTTPLRIAAALPIAMMPAQEPAAEDPVTPQWLTIPREAPSGVAALAAWRECLQGDAGAAMHLAPELALSACVSPGERPIVYARWAGENGSAPHLGALAVLPERTHRVHVPGLPIWLALRGRRVMDNRLVGDNSAPSLAQFIRDLRELLIGGQAQCIIFADLETDAPLRRALSEWPCDPELAVFCPTEPLPHWWIRFPDQAEEYWKQFSKKTRYNFRYRAKHLEHRVVRVTDPGQVRGFLDQVHALSRRTWQHRRLGHCVGATGAERRFWEHVAELGAFRSYLLEQNGKAIAYALGYQWRGCYSHEYTGYDPACAAKSPGQVLLYRIIEDLIACNTPQWLDFGFGHSQYKEVFANHRTFSGPMVLVRREWRSMAIMRLDQINRWTARASRAVLKQLGVLSSVRQLYRRGREDKDKE